MLSMWFAVSLSVSVLIPAATPKPGREISSISAKGFSVEYFSDGSYVAMNNGVAVPGMWDSSDGFFKLPTNVTEKKLVGSCSFSADRSWECSYPPRMWKTDDGGLRGVGGSLFHGMGFSGLPGGRLRTELEPQRSI